MTSFAALTPDSSFPRSFDGLRLASILNSDRQPPRTLLSMTGLLARNQLKSLSRLSALSEQIRTLHPEEEREAFGAWFFSWNLSAIALNGRFGEIGEIGMRQSRIAAPGGREPFALSTRQAVSRQVRRQARLAAWDSYYQAFARIGRLA